MADVATDSSALAPSSAASPPPGEAKDSKRRCATTEELALSSEQLAGSDDLEDAGPAAGPIAEPVEQVPSAATGQGCVPVGIPGIGGRLRHYEILRELGRGGMGAVYLARDTKLARRVAIKFLLDNHLQRTAEGAARVHRFLAEARTTARCQHENIVVIHEADEYRGYPYMVLEYLQGKNLRAFCRHQPVPVQRTVEIALPVVRALERAHEHGIVHRDLKPENVFVTDTGVIKVLDFGIAKLLSRHNEEPPAAQIRPLHRGSHDHATKTGALIGTLPYMSPEQLRGSKVDQRSDVWAVGIMLYELVDGRHPLAPLDAQKLADLADGDNPIPSARQRLPHIGPLAELIDRCLHMDKAKRIATASELRVALEACDASHGTGLRDDGCPFVGLAAFEGVDADRFFGRSTEIATIVAQVRSRPLVTVVGPSGAGKSSLIRAGVIPALERSGEGWDAIILRPGRRPLNTLAEALLHAGTGGASDGTSQVASAGGDSDVAAERVRRSELISHLRDQPGYFGAELRRRARLGRQRVIILVDQFEELYTLGADKNERWTFIKCLEGAADDVGSPLRVVVTIRSDFLERAVNDGDFITDFISGLTFLPPMDREGLREALTAPVAASGYRYQSRALIDTMLDALAATPGALPLLQFAASRLWQGRDRDNKMLTQASYEAMGGIAGTLVSHADTVLAAMTAGTLRLARGLFLRLVTPERTRAIASMDELCQLSSQGRDVEEIVHYLADARLLAVEDGDEPGTSTVELIHESLIESWPTLRRWLDDNQEDAEFLARLRVASQEWDKSGQSQDFLWRGHPAQEAQAWRMRYSGELSMREQRFLDAVFAWHRRTIRRRRLAVAGTMTFLAIVAVAALIALIWIQRAENQASLRAARLAEQVAKNQRLIEQRDDLLQQEKAARQQAETAAEQARQAEAAAQRAQAEEEKFRHQAEMAAEEALTLSVREQAARRQAEDAANTAAAAKNQALAAKNDAEAKAEQLRVLLEEKQRILDMARQEHRIPQETDLSSYQRDHP